jgi:hypothetical protein
MARRRLHDPPGLDLVPTVCPQALQATHFRLHIIGFNVEMYPRFLRPEGLEQHVQGWPLWGGEPRIG